MTGNEYRSPQMKKNVLCDKKKTGHSGRYTYLGQRVL